MADGNLSTVSSDILVVDDVSENLKLLRSLLVPAGYKVRPASNGAEALDAVMRKEPDLILLDIRMPGMDGFEVCKRLKADSRSEQIPIIFISALGDTADKVKAFQAGGVDYITKPFQEEEVLMRVQTHIELHRMRMNLEKIVAERTLNLRMSEERFRSTFEQAAVGIAHVSPEGTFLRVNKKFSDIVGFTREEMLARTFQDITHPDDLDADLEHVRQLLAGESETYSMEKRYVRKDGQTVWVSLTVSLLREDTGEPRYFIAVVEDITERKQAERRMRMMEFSIDHSLDRVAWLGPDGRFLYANEAACAEMGYTREELLSMTVSDLDPLYPPEVWAEHYERLKRMGHMWMETQHTSKDGQIHFLEVSANRLVFGETEFLCSFGRDITKRKRAEEALRVSRDELRRLAGRLLSAQEDERRRLARELHDDLTQQLASLAMDVAVLESSVRSASPDAGEELKQIAGRIRKLTGHVGEMARQLHPSILDDLGLVKAMESQCARFAKRTGTAVEFTGDVSPEGIPADAALALYRILQESLRNVRQHARALQVGVTLDRVGDDIRLTIRDSGIGFDTEDAREGTGLGLASMRERVGLLDGTFSLWAQLGEGTTVEASIPLQRTSR